MTEPQSDYISDIIMLSVNQNMSYLLVEGERDYTALISIISKDHVSIKPTEYGDGKELVLRCMKDPIVRKQKNIIALVDADYDRLLNTLELIDNVIYSETHDLDLDILCSGVVEKVFDKLIESRKAGHIMKNLHVNLLREAIDYAYQFGIPKMICVRAYKAATVPGLFEELDETPPVTDFCKWRKNRRRIDVDRFIQETQRIHNHINFDNEIAQEISKCHPALQVARGHDVMSLLTFLCKPYLGRTRLKPDEMATYIQLAFEMKHFENMTLHSKFKEWESNSSQILLKS